MYLMKKSIKRTVCMLNFIYIVQSKYIYNLKSVFRGPLTLSVVIHTYVFEKQHSGVTSPQKPEQSNYQIQCQKCNSVFHLLSWQL